MPDLRTDAEDPVIAIEQAATEEEALALEAALLEQSDNGLHPGDPEDQPPSEPPDPGAIQRPPSSVVDRVIARFESQIGTTERPPGSNKTVYCDWYGLTGPWCAMFVSWCFFNEGVPLPATISKGFASTLSGAHWFQKQGRWTQTPERGHVVFFDFPNDSVNRISHVGIVVGVNPDGSIDTIEGNTDERGGRTGGKVMRRRRKVGIVGYGIPAYEDRGDAGDAGDAEPATTTGGAGGEPATTTGGAGGEPATTTGGAGPGAGVPPWAHEHGGVIRAPHNNCGTVRQWQQRMKDRGRQIVVDADYGPASARVCRAFQREHGLVVDGVVGPKTWARSWE